MNRQISNSGIPLGYPACNSLLPNDSFICTSSCGIVLHIMSVIRITCYILRIRITFYARILLVPLNPCTFTMNIECTKRHLSSAVFFLTHCIINANWWCVSGTRTSSVAQDVLRRERQVCRNAYAQVTPPPPQPPPPPPPLFDTENRRSQ